MLVEATLDFPEEEIDFLEKSNARGQLAGIVEALEHVFRQAAQGALLREGLNVVLVGQPNVGKSSLLNALAGADVAIVTPIAGTTRDKVSETIQIEGIPLNIIDTAGIRALDEGVDVVERIGIERTWGEVGKADVILHLLDANLGPTRPTRHRRRLPGRRAGGAHLEQDRPVGPQAGGRRERGCDPPLPVGAREASASTCCARNCCASPAGSRPANRCTWRANAT
jgi:cellobiose-specific phosphotransferase system component IIB